MPKWGLVGVALLVGCGATSRINDRGAGGSTAEGGGTATGSPVGTPTGTPSGAPSGTGSGTPGGAEPCVVAEDCTASSECKAPGCLDGICVDVYWPAGTPCSIGACDGLGFCLDSTPNGEPCTNAAECGSGECIDGFCCESTCEGFCEGCGVMGSEGLCRPQLPGTDPDAECGAGVCDGGASCAVGNHEASRGFGGLGRQEARDLVIDAAGYRYVLGSFDDAVDLGGGLVPSQGGVDFFVVKLSPTGSLVWGKVFGGPGDDLARRLAVSAMGEVLVAGAFFGSLELGVAPLVSAGLSDAFVLRLDASTGDLVRAERFGDEEAQAIAGLAVDGAGDVVVAGSFSGTIDFGGGELTAAGVGDAFVAKRSSAGAHRWSARFGLGGDAQWVDVALTPSGDAVVGGDFDGAVDLGSGPLASNGRDVMLVELDGASGAPQIGRVVAGAGHQEVTALAVDGSGHLALSGRNLGTVDFGGGALAATNFVVTTSASGEHVWSRAFGTTDAAFEDVTFDAAGGVVVVGSLDGSIDFGGGAIATTSRDAIVVRFHQSGAHLWSHAFGAGGSERAQAVAVDTQGRTVVAGSFTQAVDFGGGVIGVAGASDLFFLQLAP